MRPILLKNNLELQVFELQTEAKTVVYQNGRPVCSLSLKKNGEKIEGVLQGEGNVKIRFVNRKLRAVQGADVKIDGNDTVITMKQENLCVRCKMRTEKEQAMWTKARKTDGEAHTG